MKICTVAKQNCNNKLKKLANTKLKLLKLQKCFNVVPEWQNFAKSGHTVSKRSRVQNSHPLFLIPCVPTYIVSVNRFEVKMRKPRMGLKLPTI